MRHKKGFSAFYQRIVKSVSSPGFEQKLILKSKNGDCKMTINDIQDKYLVKDSSSDEGTKMAHIFYINEETISLHKEEKLFFPNLL